MEHNREPRIYPHIHIQLIFYKGANAIEWEKTSLLTTADISTRVLQQLDIHIEKNTS